MVQIKRRNLVIAGGVTLTALLMGGMARADAPRVVGWLTGGSPKSDARLLAAFREGLKAHGWVEGKNLRFEPRFAEGKPQRLPVLAAELIKLKPDVIFSGATPVHLVLKEQTSTIPIVMGTGADPVAVGLVPSLAHPGGNITGMVGFLNETSIKMVEIVASLIPPGSRVVLLLDVNTPFTRPEHQEQVMHAAHDLGIQAEYIKVATKEDVERAFTGLAKNPPSAMVGFPSLLLWHVRRDVIKNTAKLKLPSIYPFEAFADAGGLMSYSAPLAESYRDAATFVDRILRGTKPGDLPIEQPTRLKLVVNLKTAKAQGVTIPQSVLVRADRVIQ